MIISGAKQSRLNNWVLLYINDMSRDFLQEWGFFFNAVPTVARSGHIILLVCIFKLVYYLPTTVVNPGFSSMKEIRATYQKMNAAREETGRVEWRRWSTTTCIFEPPQ